MLRDILEEKGLSVYKVSKEADISYSTLNDIVIEKTDIKKSSAELLYRLSKYLEISMETLYTANDDNTEKIYIHNKGRNIVVETRQYRHQYLGPKNLISITKINKVEGHVVYVDAVFKDSEIGFVMEEEYIDLRDIFEEDQYILDCKYLAYIGRAKKITKDELIDESLMVSDNFSFKLFFMPDSTEPMLEVRNIARMNYKAVVKMDDFSVIETNMGSSMQKRAIDAVKRNSELLQDESVVLYHYA